MLLARPGPRFSKRPLLSRPLGGCGQNVQRCAFAQKPLTWRSPNYLEEIRNTKVNSDDVDFFYKADWSRKWLQDDRFSPIITSSRVPKENADDAFFSTTLQTPSTIPKWVLLVHERILSRDAESKPVAVGTSGSSSQPDVAVLMSLQQGLTGFEPTVHGGVLCAILDEVLGLCVEFHRHSQTDAREELFTANLNIDFRRPLLTPGNAIVKSWVTSHEGRKWRLEGHIEDEAGHVCTEAKGLWISAKS